MGQTLKFMGRLRKLAWTCIPRGGHRAAHLPMGLVHDSDLGVFQLHLQGSLARVSVDWRFGKLAPFAEPVARTTESNCKPYEYPKNQNLELANVDEPSLVALRHVLRVSGDPMSWHRI